MYKSIRKFSYSNGENYAIGSESDIVVEKGGDENSPPFQVIHKAETQEVLKELYDLGHNGVILVSEESVIEEPIKKAKKPVE